MPAPAPAPAALHPSHGPFGIRQVASIARAPDPRYAVNDASALTPNARLYLVALTQHASNTPLDAHRRRCFAAGVDPERVGTIDLRDLAPYGRSVSGEPLGDWSAGPGGWGSRALAALLGRLSPRRPGQARTDRGVNTQMTKALVLAWHEARVVDIRGKVVWIFNDEIAHLDGRGGRKRAPVSWPWGAPACGSGGGQGRPQREPVAEPIAAAGDRSSIDRS